MALQVWLPLIRDLSNQGLANVTITNNGATFSSDGKLGGCYYFTPEQWIKISVPEHMTTIKNTTVAVWVKSHSTSSAVGGISHDGNSDLAGVTLTSGGWQISGSAGAWKYVNSGTIANTQVWHHAACTIDDNEITIYLDGVKVTTSTLTAQGIVNTDITSSNFIEIGCDHPGGNEFFTGYINDFRVYDHCLSAKEIKELSKGLVLHYKLDNSGTGPTNLLKNGFGELGTENWDIPANVTTTDLPTVDSSIKAKVLNTTSEEFIPVYRNHIYKISAYIKSSTGATTGYTYPSIRVYDIDKYEIQNFHTLVGFDLATMTTLKQDLKSGDTKIYVNDLSAWNANSGTYYNYAAIFGYTDSTGYTYPDGVYTRTTPTFGTGTNAKTNLDKTNNIITLNTAYSGPTILAGTSVCASTAGSTYFYPFGGITHASIQNWVFKEATFSAENDRIVAAAYMKVMSYVNSYLAGITLTDESINNMLDHTKEFDCSGYEHNGTIAGTLSNSENSAKYSASTYFENYNDYIYCNLDNNIPDEITMSCWIKSSNKSPRGGFHNPITIHSTNFEISILGSSGKTRIGYMIGGTRYVKDVGSDVLDNQWHMLTGTYDGQKICRYVDGELVDSQSISGALTTLDIIRVGSVNTTYGNTQLYQSDVRIYTTALSAEDVAELYHTAANIDNHGNIYAGELKEV